MRYERQKSIYTRQIPPLQPPPAPAPPLPTPPPPKTATPTLNGVRAYKGKGGQQENVWYSKDRKLGAFFVSAQHYL